MSTEQEFLDNICRIIGHDFTTAFMTNDTFKMVINFEKTCSRCNRSGKAVVRYNEMYERRFPVLDRVHRKIEEEFNSSPHKKL